MITVYTKNGHGLHYTIGSVLPDDIVWIDLHEPTLDEVKWCETLHAIVLPKQHDMGEIQISSQLFIDNQILYMTTPIVAGVESHRTSIGALSFILTQDVLVTLRYLDPKFILLFIDYFKTHCHAFRDSADVLLGLLDIMVARSADVLELVGDQIDKASHIIFDNQNGAGMSVANKNLKNLLHDVGHAGDMVGRLRNAMAGTERMCVFLNAIDNTHFDSLQASRIKVIQGDLHALAQHSDALNNRVAFLLDAVLGIISIEQNNIVRIFSVAATAFLPPTLVASIYGMNFKFMPELDWFGGYPMALFFMIMSALLPMLYFRKKGWL